MKRFATAIAAIAALTSPLFAGDLLAIRVGKAETVSQGTIEHAVILVEDGKIVTIGQDLPVDRGIPTLDLPDATVVPGLVHAYSRIGMDSQGAGGSQPQAMASGELYPRQDVWGEVLEHGVTTLGLYPSGMGIPGQSVAVRPHGTSKSAMIVRDGAYLKIDLMSNAGSKKALRDGFEKVKKFEEKEAERLAKWEKDQEKAKKKKKSKKKDDDEDEKDEKKEPEEFVPGTPDPDVAAFQKLKNGELQALISIRSAGNYLHLLDAVGDEDFPWSLRIGLRNDINIHEVVDQIGDDELRCVVEPILTLHPNTRRLRNLPAELAAAGAKVAFVPRADRLWSIEDWRTDVGEVVKAGLDPQDGLRAMTLEPAEVLGLADRVGSLDVGKDANLLFLSGDPFEPSTRIEAVMLEGEIVFGEVN